MEWLKNCCIHSFFLSSTVSSFAIVVAKRTSVCHLKVATVVNSMTFFLVTWLHSESRNFNATITGFSSTEWFGHLVFFLFSHLVFSKKCVHPLSLFTNGIWYVCMACFSRHQHNRTEYTVSLPKQSSKREREYTQKWGP